MPAPSTANRNGPIVYKRIRIQDSDSDDNPSPAKKVVVELTTAVKERRFRNMLEMFPDISPLVSLRAHFNIKMYIFILVL